jgi:hypothetical protein
MLHRLRGNPVSALVPIRSHWHWRMVAYLLLGMQSSSSTKMLQILCLTVFYLQFSAFCCSEQQD